MRRAVAGVAALVCLIVAATPAPGETVRHIDPADLLEGAGGNFDLEVLASQTRRRPDGTKVLIFWASTYGGQIGFDSFTVNIDSLEGGHRDYSVVCEGTWCGLDRNDDGAFWRVRAMIREVDGVERFVVYVPRSRLRIRKPVRWWVFSDAGTMESSDTAPNDGRYLL